MKGSCNLSGGGRKKKEGKKKDGRTSRETEVEVAPRWCQGLTAEHEPTSTIAHRSKRHTCSSSSSRRSPPFHQIVRTLKGATCLRYTVFVLFCFFNPKAFYIFLPGLKTVWCLFFPLTDNSHPSTVQWSECVCVCKQIMLYTCYAAILTREGGRDGWRGGCTLVFFSPLFLTACRLS